LPAKYLKLKFSPDWKKHIVPSSRMKMLGNHKHHILVVDDEPTVARAIKMLLEHDGHTVETADSGEAALAIIEHGKFDLIITDYSMQGMKGVELAALIKQRHPDQPIIMATAFAADFNNSGKPSAGVNLVISKPFSQKELREAVATVLP
jgi:CheY-like chemotaxis protein